MTILHARDFETRWQLVSREPSTESLCRAVRLRHEGAAVAWAGVRNTDGAPALLLEMRKIGAPSRGFRFNTDAVTLIRQEELAETTILMALILEDRRLQSLFAVLAADVAQFVMAPDGSDPGARLETRLVQWQAALRTRRDILSQEAALGLVGELDTLLVISSIVGPTAALASWTGPERGLRDFTASQIGIEVKTQSGDDLPISISGIDQLTVGPLRRLALRRIIVAERTDGTSLPEMIARTRQAMGCPELERLLAVAGWRDEDALIHIDRRYLITETALFEVTADFPAITRHNASPGIVDARYEIDPRAISKFVLGAIESEILIRELGGTLGQ